MKAYAELERTVIGPESWQVVSTDGPDQGHVLYRGTEKACRLFAAGFNMGRRRVTGGDW